jgi:serine/threonine protein kinase
MGSDVFLEHYRFLSGKDEPPVEIAHNGPAVTYKASDLRTGAPVALTLVPVASVDPAEIDRFEEKARTAVLLDHENIARIVAFGRADDSFVFVSEYPQGETVEAWVKANGPMPADAVLRVALQVVAALGAASFHGLNHPAIQPSNLVIVSGKTAEGGWPFVKLTHFFLASLKSAPGFDERDLGTSDFASPEQLLQGKVDFRSEIYSLGATMCFLLTGVFYSAYPRSPQTKRFSRPLRALIAKTLEDDPAARPQDPVLFNEELRTCLGAIERRQNLRRQFGIPFPPVVAKPPRPRRFRRQRPIPLVASLDPTASPPQPTRQVIRSSGIRPVWQIAAGVVALLAVGLIAALFLPEDIVTSALHRKKTVENIGVPVGIPDASPATVVQGNANPSSSAHQSSNTTVTAAATSQSPGAKAMPAAKPESTIAPAAVITQNSPPPPDQMISSTVRQAPETRDRLTEAPVTAAAPESRATPVAAVSRGTDIATPDGSPSAQIAANNALPAPPAEGPSDNAQDQPDQPIVAGPGNVDVDSAPAGQAPPPPVTEANPDVTGSRPAKSPAKKSSSLAQSKSRSTKARVPRALPVEPDLGPTHSGTFRARVVGVTPAGNVILALPSGERAIVSPQDADHYGEAQRPHRRPHRVIIQRRIYVPQYPSPYQPFASPDD